MANQLVKQFLAISGREHSKKKERMEGRKKGGGGVVRKEKGC
jgi:hypothetical protein